VTENLFRTHSATDELDDDVVIPAAMHFRAKIGVLNPKPLQVSSPRSQMHRHGVNYYAIQIENEC
jgi:hypothetical protein